MVSLISLLQALHSFLWTSAESLYGILQALSDQVISLVVSQLDCHDLGSLGMSCRDLYCRLQPYILKWNIQRQNSSLLHLAARDNDYVRAELMLFYGADANTFLHGKTPLMRAIQYGASDVLELLLSHKKIDLRMHNREKENALTYAMKYRRCGGRKAIQPQRHLAIRDERDQGLLPLAPCKS
jgi:ankyrin repeat protein